MWKKLMPTKIQTETFTQEVQIPYTELEQMILKICHKSSLTDNQREFLNTNIIVRDGNVDHIYTHPNAEYHSNWRFREFADAKIQVMANYGASPGKIIKTLTNYAHPNGWLAYKKAQAKDESGSTGTGNANSKPILGGSISRNNSE